MKTLLTLLLLSTAGFAQTQLNTISPRAIPLAGVAGRYRSIITRNLVKYEEVQVLSSNATDIVFTYKEGMVKMGLEDMPAEVQKTYNYNPAVQFDPAVQAQQKKEREEGIQLLKKNPTRVKLVIEQISSDTVICRAYLVVMEKTNKRAMSGAYVMKEVPGKKSSRAIVLGAAGKPVGFDFGIVDAYPCGVDRVYGQKYALDPEAAFDLIKDSPVKKW